MSAQPCINRAVVVGGGIVGLVAAVAMAGRGVRTVLVERNPTIADDGGIGMGLQSNALAALKRVGLAAPCLEVGVPVDHLELFAPDGRPIGRPPIARNSGPGLPGFVGIFRAELHAILVAAAEKAGVELLAGTTVADLTQGQGDASVRLTSGRLLQADLVVGADGIYSMVRRQLFPEHADAVATGEADWRARISPADDYRGIGIIYGGRVGTVGYTPISHGDGYLYAVDRVERGPPREADDLRARFAALVADYGGFPRRLLPNLADEVHWRPLETVRLPAPWYQGRAVLIGDAAHAGPPTLAQGTAMGIEDAVVLAEELAAAADLPAALASFMRRRHERVRTVVEASIAISSAQMSADGGGIIARAQQSAAAALAEPF